MTVEASELPGYFSPVSAIIAENLQRLRMRRKVSQQQVAEALGLKRSANVSQWESGTRTPSKATLQRLAKYYGVLVREIDPEGDVWDPERPRIERKLKKRGTPADSVRQGQDHHQEIGDVEDDVRTEVLGFFDSLKRNRHAQLELADLVREFVLKIHAKKARA